MYYVIVHLQYKVTGLHSISYFQAFCYSSLHWTSLYVHVDFLVTSFTGADCTIKPNAELNNSCGMNEDISDNYYMSN